MLFGGPWCAQLLPGALWGFLVRPGAAWGSLVLPGAMLLVVPLYSLVLLGALLVATSCDSTYPTGWLQHSLGKWMCLVR